MFILLCQLLSMKPESDSVTLRARIQMNMTRREAGSIVRFDARRPISLRVDLIQK